jgi:hypothetical protein
VVCYEVHLCFLLLLRPLFEFDFSRLLLICLVQQALGQTYIYKYTTEESIVFSALPTSILDIRSKLVF